MNTSTVLNTLIALERRILRYFRKPTAPATEGFRSLPVITLENCCPDKLRWPFIPMGQVIAVRPEILILQKRVETLAKGVFDSPPAIEIHEGLLPGEGKFRKGDGWKHEDSMARYIHRGTNGTVMISSDIMELDDAERWGVVVHEFRHYAVRCLGKNIIRHDAMMSFFQRFLPAQDPVELFEWVDKAALCYPVEERPEETDAFCVQIVVAKFANEDLPGAELLARLRDLILYSG
jgi:hypothetical protein